MKRSLLWIVCCMPFLSGCLGMPERVQPVNNFELDKYLGTWHEIARLDHVFERGLTQITAEYTLREDDGVNVINRGFHAEDGEWKEAVGRAYFVEGNNTGHLKVSFFGPFYSSYVVFGLDQEEYQYAFVSGYSNDYVWLLARTPEVSQRVKMEFVQAARERGFDTGALIWNCNVIVKGC